MPEARNSPTSSSVRPAGAGAVVVGVDGSDVNRVALRRAALEAAVHEAPLVIVHAWNFLDQPSQPFDPHYGELAATARIRRVVDETLGAGCGDGAELRLVNDHAAHALVDASVGALVLVVGARGLGGLTGILLGSVSQHVVHHASCPVLIVR
jgi:nucleotide-binding universal stress UspA family protein